MTNEEMKIQSRKGAPQIKIAGGIWVVGFMIIMTASVIWVVLAVIAGDYYSSSKSIRDAAESGSGLLSHVATCCSRRLLRYASTRQTAPPARSPSSGSP